MLQQRSLLLHAPRQLAWVADTLPPLGSHDLLLRTRAGAISIGTELPIYLGSARSIVARAYPTMTGYESLAEGADRGASGSLDPVTETPTPDHYQLGFECSSRDRAFQLLQAALAPRGRACILADGNIEPLTLAPAFHVKELTVIGSSDGLDYRTYARWY